jgi:cytochrome P450
MNRFVPPYPKPMPAHGRVVKVLMRPYKFVRSLRCSLASLMDRSYSMHMGEVGLPHKKIFVANQPDLVQRVLITDIADFPKSKVVADMFGTLVGDGLIVSNGEIWRRQRRIMAPVFEQTRNKLVFDLMMDAVEAMIGRFETIVEAGGEAAVDVEMTHVTADVIYRTIFGEALRADDAKRAFGAFQAFQEAAFAYGMARMAGMPPVFPLGGLGEARKQAKVIRDFLDPKVRDRFERHKAGEDQLGNDILGALIAATDPEDGSRFDLRELSEQVAMLFLGGHETSASTLAWNFFLIAKDQEVQDRLAREAKRVLGEGRPHHADIRRLKFARNVFSETLRLYPPIAFLPRDAACPMTMRDKTIARGSVVHVSPWLMHRHRRYWQKPDEFDPDRFDRPETQEPLRSCYFPFSKGPRVCIGASFAQQEAILALACLVRRFRFDPIPGVEPKPIGRLTVRSENGIHLRVSRREVVG